MGAMAVETFTFSCLRKIVEKLCAPIWRLSDRKTLENTNRI